MQMTSSSIIHLLSLWETCATNAVKNNNNRSSRLFTVLVLVIKWMRNAKIEVSERIILPTLDGVMLNLTDSMKDPGVSLDPTLVSENQINVVAQNFIL